MKVEIVDMNLPANEELWKNRYKAKSSCGVYIYDFPLLYMDEHEADVFVFLWDDGKGKHESYEAHLMTTPFKYVSNNHTTEATFYGADRSEALKEMTKWLDEHVNFVIELRKEVCEASSELPAE